MDLVQGIDHVALAVRDVALSAEWYQRVLGLRRVHQKIWGDFPAMVGIGTTSIALFPIQSDQIMPPPAKNVVAMRHLAFRASREGFEAARVRLGELGIEFAFQDHEIAHSIYFRDPDGHELEITTYELVAPG